MIVRLFQFSETYHEGGNFERRVYADRTNHNHPEDNQSEREEEYGIVDGFGLHLKEGKLWEVGNDFGYSQNDGMLSHPNQPEENENAEIQAHKLHRQVLSHEIQNWVHDAAYEWNRNENPQEGEP